MSHDATVIRPGPAGHRRFGKYDIVSVLGEGGMGVVYKGRDPDLQRHVAIKMIHKDLLQGEMGVELRARFRNEMLATSKLAHPNIVTLFDAGEIDGEPYFVMEFVEGRLLADYFKEGIRFPLQQAIKIITQVLTGLAYTHKLGVVHRDLKPANIFITDNDNIKIADFGIAKLDSSELTRVGAVLGSPRYMSPEQCVGEAVDQRSDLFSAGLLFYELLTGEHCFHANASHTVIHKIINAKPELPSALNPTLPRAMDKVIERALAKKPQERFASAEEFIQAIREAELELTGGSKSGSGARWVPWAAGAGVLAAAGLAVVLLLPGKEVPVSPPAKALPEARSQDAGTRPAGETPVTRIESISAEKGEKIERLLKVANVHAKVGRLIAPSGGNAYDAYQIVLSIDPANETAKQGIVDVRERLLALSSEQLAAGDAQAALASVDAGLSLFPDEPNLIKLRQRIAGAQ